MGSSFFESKISSDFVLMPWEDETYIAVPETKQEDENLTNKFSRWNFIQQQLHKSNNITNINKLINVIKSYNVFTDEDGRVTKPNWNCSVLLQYFAQMEQNDKDSFFSNNGLLSSIRNLSLQMKELVPNIKLLKTGSTSHLTLHQLQLASILAGAFLCIFPQGKADCPSINFNTLYEGSSSLTIKNCVEKLKCIIHYFKRVHTKQPIGNVSFYRICIPDHKFPRWDKTSVDLCSLIVDEKGKIENQDGYLQMDFANKYVGGGVLGKGCVQEEIRFIVCPELIASRLFTECLADNESLLIVGAERYCQYTGYSTTFKFSGDFQDLAPFDETGHRKTYLIVLDAFYFRQSSDQYKESKILRELKKAYTGFKPLDGMAVLPLATGNWGCGAFGGDPQLKSILQLMASSQAQRDVLYLTFGNSILKNQIQEIYNLLKEKSVNVGMLYRIIRLYHKERRKNQTVFEYIKESVNKIKKSTYASCSGQCSSTFQFESLSAVEELTTKFENKKVKMNIISGEESANINGTKKVMIQSLLKKHIISKDNCEILKNVPTMASESASNFSDRRPSILELMYSENEAECVSVAKRKCVRESNN